MLVAMVGCNNIDPALDVIVQIVGQAESDAGIQCYLFCMRNRGNVLCSAMRIPLYATILIYSICAFIPRVLMLWDMVKLAEISIRVAAPKYIPFVYILIFTILISRILSMQSLL